jgi:hypothetical protein
MGQSLPSVMPMNAIARLRQMYESRPSLSRDDQIILLDCILGYLETNRNAIEATLEVIYDNRDVAYFGGPPPFYSHPMWINVGLLVENRQTITHLREIKQGL